MNTQTESGIEVRKLTEEQLKAKIVELNAKLESYEFLKSYAQDAVNMFPTITLRTMWKLVKAMADIKEALTYIK